MRLIDKWRLRLLGAVTVAMVSAGAGAQTDDAGGKFKPSVDSSVRVLALMPDGRANYGTGWVIEAADKDNRAGAAVVVTARHIVAGAVKVTVVEADSPIQDQRIGTVINSTTERDVAFIEVKDLAETPLTLTRAVPNIGDTVRAAGYAAASDANEVNRRATRASLKLGGFSKFFRGPISNRAQAPVDQIEFDAPILAGFSGGPVLNECGRVIGMTVKDGGHIRLGEGAEISVAQGVSVALSSNEIIKAANDSGVKVKVVATACGDAAGAKAPPPPPPPPCSEPFISQEKDGRVCAPKTPTPTQTFLHKLGGPNAAILGVAGAGLLIVVVTVGLLLRKPAGPNPAPVTPLPNNPTGRDGNSRLVDDGVSKNSHGRTLRLTGRGPSGEAIDLRFAADELVGQGVTLGVAGDAGARIPDTRPQTLVSRRHARLVFEGSEFRIEDNRSTNGVFVGGLRIPPMTPRALVSGDQLMLADVVLNVIID